MAGTSGSNNTTIGLSNNTAEDPYSHCTGNEIYWQNDHEEFLELCIFPIVIIVGSVLNIFAIIVLQTRTYRKTSTGFLMTALSVADLGLLLTGILRKWILALTDYTVDIRTFSSGSCKVHIFFTYFFQYLSSWTLALITIERAVSVCNPFRCRELCSMKKIVLGWVVICVGMFLCNMHFFWMYDVVWAENRGSYKCHGLESYYHFLYDGYHNWIDLIVPCFAPFAVIIGCNITIVYKLVAGVSERKHMSASSSGSSHQTSSTTVMLLCVSTMFLVLVAPFAIFTLGESYGCWKNVTAQDCAILDLAYSYTYLLFNINSAVNFLLYCVSGTKFRRVLVSLLCPTIFARSGKPVINSCNAENAPRLSTGAKMRKFSGNDKHDKMSHTLVTTVDTDDNKS